MSNFLDSYTRAKQMALVENERLKTVNAEKFQGEVSEYIGDISGFQGQFKWDGGSWSFGDVAGGNFKAFPGWMKAWGKYKGIAKKYGKKADVNEFRGLYAQAEQAYGAALSGKIKSLSDTGVKKEDITEALYGNQKLVDAIHHFNQYPEFNQVVSDYTVKASEGMIPGGAKEAYDRAGSLAVARGVQASRGYAAGGWGEAARRGLIPGSGTLDDFYKTKDIATKGLKKGVGTKIKAQVGKSGMTREASRIANRSSKDIKNIAKAFGSKAKSASKNSALKFVTNYIKKHGMGDLVKTITKKAGPRMAWKLLGRGVLGGAATVTGLGTVAGLAMNAWTAYDIYNILMEAAKDAEGGENVQEMLLGGGTPQLPKGTTF